MGTFFHDDDGKKYSLQFLEVITILLLVSCNFSLSRPGDCSVCFLIRTIFLSCTKAPVMFYVLWFLFDMYYYPDEIKSLKKHDQVANRFVLSLFDFAFFRCCRTIKYFDGRHAAKNM